MNRNVSGVVVIIVAAFLVITLQARAADEKPETPAVLKGGKVISTDEAKALLDRKEARFFDMRAAVNFGKGHLPTAVAMPYKGKSEDSPDFDSSKDEFDLSQLPADKGAKIVFYSHGSTGWKSYKAAVLAVKAGYKNIMWMREGYDSWVAKKYQVEM